MKKEEVKHYRIGDYAQKMGVTPDLLKHYEKMKLIHAYTEDNGYRYYPFTESIPLLESLSLRNYDLSLQEIHELLYEGTLDHYHDALSEKVQVIRRRMTMDQALLHEFEVLDKWMTTMKDRTLYMLMEEREPYYFLPHSKRHDFLEDARIQELLPGWIEWMPVVKSCRKINYQPDTDCLSDASWGFSVPESAAMAFGLPINDVVERMPGGRHLICHYRNVLSKERNPNAFWHQIQEKLAETGMMPSGPILQILLTSILNTQNRVTCGMYVIPLQDANA